MFNKLTIIKIIVLGIAVYALFPSLNSTDTKVENGYTDLPSYFPGDTAILYFHNSKPPVCGRVLLYDAHGNIVDQVICRVNSQEINKNKPWENGFNYKISGRYIIPDNLKSGVYCWNKKIPMVIKNKEKDVDLMVVFPYATLSAVSSQGGKSFMVHNSSEKKIAPILSLLRPVFLDKYSKTFLPIIDTLKYKTGFITDIDLNESSSFHSANTLLIYGYADFWAPEALKNLQNFIINGGNVIILTSAVFRYKFWYNSLNQQIRKREDCNSRDQQNFVLSWKADDCLVCNYTGINHGYSGGTDQNSWGGFMILSPHHPLLKGTGLKKQDILPLPSGYYTGSDCISIESDGRKYRQSNCLSSSEFQIIGFERCSKDRTGLFAIVKPDSGSGTVILFGAREWTSPHTLKNQLHKRIILNAIKLSVKNKPVFKDSING